MDLAEIKQFVNDPEMLTYEAAYSFYKDYMPWLVSEVELLTKELDFAMKAVVEGEAAVEKTHKSMTAEADLSLKIDIALDESRAEVEKLKAETKIYHEADNLEINSFKAENIKLCEVLRRAKVDHRVVDDCWYSCPKSGECCNGEPEDFCSCGADDHNRAIDEALKGDE